MIDAKSQMSSITVFAAGKGYADPALLFLGSTLRLADPEVQLPDALIQRAMNSAGFCEEMADPMVERMPGLCSFRATSIHADGRPTAVAPWGGWLLPLGWALPHRPSPPMPRASSGETAELYDAGSGREGRPNTGERAFTQLKPVFSA
jgi:hypothetical protein